MKWNGETDAYRIPYSGASALRSAVVDPDNRIVIDDDPKNDFATVPGHPSAGAPRVFERAAFWAATLLGGIAP